MAKRKSRAKSRPNNVMTARDFARLRKQSPKQLTQEGIESAHQAVAQALAECSPMPQTQPMDRWRARAEGLRELVAQHVVGQGRTFTEGTGDDPLTDTQQRVYEVIRAHGPIMGTAICRQTGIEQSTLTRHIIPVLKTKRKVTNRRGAGYYIPDPT